MGAATRRTLLAAAPFVPRPMPFAAEGSGLPDLADRTPLQIGPFTITPYLVDHSAFDAYALLVEAGGQRLFYSGDLRAHGRKGALFERLLRDPPRNVHAMLMEGSSLGRLDPGQRFPTEAEVESQLVERLRPLGFAAVCTLYDGDGTRLAGGGPELTLEMTEGFPFKALLHDKPGIVDVAVLAAGDRLWLLPDSFGTPPVLPMLLLTDLAHVARRGRKVGLAARNEDAYVLVRDALMLLLDDSGGRA